MAGQTAGPIKTKLGMGTHVDPGSVLGKVKVKVMWRHLARKVMWLTEARKGRDNRARSAINLRPEDGYLQLVVYMRLCRAIAAVYAENIITGHNAKNY